jgi:dihydroxyacetone kinase-like protein
MTDAMEEALGTASPPSAKELAKIAAATARTAADATTLMQALRGRASYTGERSIGSPDAGAVAVAVMAERIFEDWPSGTS